VSKEPRWYEPEEESKREKNWMTAEETREDRRVESRREESRMIV
jgi:hypothetical protein